MTTFWQFIVVLGAALGFPAAALLFLIGGPRFQDERRGPDEQGLRNR
ncbi:hypothetical protein ACFVXG_09455 [Kitasatospora sp. NPDC058162]